jgi:outer membrane protein assembly factor BamB
LARVALIALLAALALPGAAAAAPWTTFGFDPERTSSDPLETTLTPEAVRGLHQLWSTDVGGVVDTQASYTGGAVLVGTEEGEEIALDAATGTILWRRGLGRQKTTCHDTPGGVYGISAPAVIDGTRAYVAGGDGQLHALDVATGAEAPGFPVALTARPAVEHVWGGLNLFGSRVYAGLASFCDNAFYRGSLVAVDVTQARRVARIYLTRPHVFGGGVWGWGGVAIDTRNGRVYAATANAQAHRQDADLAEHVLRLSPDLKLEAADNPRVLRRGDADFGAHPILFRGAGCPPQLAVMHKSGTLLLYDRARVAKGARQRLQLADRGGQDAFSTYAWADGRLFVSLPSGQAPYAGGVVALRLGTDCRLKLGWQARTGDDHELRAVPVVAAGVVWSSAGQKLYALAASDGRRLWDSGSTFGQVIAAAPALGDGRVFASSWDGRVRAFGP